MRHFILMFICVLSSISFISCGNTAIETYQSKDNIFKYPTIGEYQEIMKDISTPRIERGVFINQSIGDLIDINIEYPQLYLYPDQELQNTINKQIFDDIIVKNEFMGWFPTRTNVEIKYEILLLSDDYICIIYNGEVTMVTHIYFRRSLTINIKTGKKVSILDFFTPEQLTEIVNAKIEGGNYSIANEPYTKEIFEKQFKDSFIKNFDPKNLDNYYYIQEDKLALLASGFSNENIVIEFEIENAPWK